MRRAQQREHEGAARPRAGSAAGALVTPDRGARQTAHRTPWEHAMGRIGPARRFPKRSPASAATVREEGSNATSLPEPAPSRCNRFLACNETPARFGPGGRDPYATFDLAGVDVDRAMRPATADAVRTSSRVGGPFRTGIRRGCGHERERPDRTAKSSATEDGLTGPGLDDPQRRPGRRPPSRGGRSPPSPGGGSGTTSSPSPAASSSSSSCWPRSSPADHRAVRAGLHAVQQHRPEQPARPARPMPLGALRRRSASTGSASSR